MNNESNCQKCDHRKKHDKEKVECILGILCLYIAISSIPFLIGLLDSNKGYGGCERAMSYIEYAFPAYPIACFLGKERP